MAIIWIFEDMRPMGKIRDSARTRARILRAATSEFSERGYNAASVSGVARRARVSKQLIHHHFHSKEALFQEVHDLKFRPSVEWAEMLPPDATDLIAERFRKRAGDAHYIRFLTWEAAGRRGHEVPGYKARQRRIAEYGAALRAMQKSGKLPAEVDYRLIQLSIFALATYPMAFGQITRLVTGRAATDPLFQNDWREFLRWVGQRLFAGTGARRKAPSGARRGRPHKAKKKPTAPAARGAGRS